MSHERAVDAITMIAPRAVGVNEWLFLDSNDAPANLAGREAATNPNIWGGIHLNSLIREDQAGVIFVANVDHTISPVASEELHYFFQRDGAAATVFEFDKFEGDFKARRWEQIEARTK